MPNCIEQMFEQQGLFWAYIRTSVTVRLIVVKPIG